MTMWAYELTAPRQLSRVEVAEPGEPGVGEVLVRFQAGGICGSDVPKFTGKRPASARDAPGPGYPMHEIAGVVEKSGDPRFAAGDRICGYSAGQAGLKELMIMSGDVITKAPEGLSVAESVVVQPLATVLFALDRLPDPAGREALVAGLGPIGLLFARVLADRGARVVGVDPIDRTDLAKTYGIDQVFVGGIADWVATAPTPAELSIEAVGHQQHTLVDTIAATAQEGHLYAFGVPDDHVYEFAMRAAFDRHLTMYFGTTLRWSSALDRAAAYLGEHRDLLDSYVSHVLPLSEVNDAYELCTTAAPGRHKVLVEAPTQ